MILATYRIARMISKEAGPFEVFTRIRSYLDRRFPDHWISDGVYCPLCVSFWAGFFVVGLSFFFIGKLIILALALSGASVLLTIKIEG